MQEQALTTFETLPSQLEAKVGIVFAGVYV
jgi:hypothetical protein